METVNILSTSELLGMALIFGLNAGIAPGPILMMVISETLRKGFRGGALVVFGSLVSDFIVAVLSLFVVGLVSQFSAIIGVLSLIGGGFLIYLGFECLSTKGVSLNIEKGNSYSFNRGVVATVFNPIPYLFWSTSGASLFFQGVEHSFMFAVSLYAIFLVIFGGSKIGIAFVVARSREFLKSSTYIWTMRTLGVLLIFYAYPLLETGVKLALLI